MTEKQLSKSEIQQLFQFMKKKEVKYYDIQLEMVDHFASEIEQQWTDYPGNWDFEQKIVTVYNKIGARGFKKIEKEKAIAVSQWFNSYFYRYIKSFFSWPKVVASALLSFLFFLLIRSHSSPYLFGNQIIIFGILVPFCIFLVATMRNDFVIGKKRLLNLTFIHSRAALFMSSIIIPFNLVKIIPFDTSSITSHIALSCSFLMILYWAAAYVSALVHCYKNFKLKYPKLV